MGLALIMLRSVLAVKFAIKGTKGDADGDARTVNFWAITSMIAKIKESILL